MKILHVINNLGSGGAEKLIEQTLPLMNKVNDIDVEVLLLTDKKNIFDKKLKEKRIRISIAPFRSIYSIRNIFYIRNYIVKGKYDVVHVHLFPSQYWVSLAAKMILKNKPKFITTEHNTYNRRRSKKYFKLIDNIIYSSYDKIISISDKTQENLISWLEIDGKKIGKFTTVENGIDLTKFSNANPYEKRRINNNFDENTKLICMIGRFCEQKDQQTLIKTMKILSESVHLLLIGEGPLKQKNQDLAEQLEVNNRVHFLGFRDDVERILKTSDIVVLSSNWEGLSLASIEGMACGKPFIASRVEGLKDIVGGYGILFEQGNEDELSKIIIELLDKRDFYNEVTDRCLERAECYDVNNMVDKLLSVYTSLMNNT